MLLLPPSAGEWAGNGMQLPGHCGSHWDGEQAGSIFREVIEELVISSSGALLGFQRRCSSSGFLEARQAPSLTGVKGHAALKQGTAAPQCQEHGDTQHVSWHHQQITQTARESSFGGIHGGN